MKDLGANVIRVYHVDPTADHKGCMSAFEDQGIYLFVDLDTFDTQINQVGDASLAAIDITNTLILLGHPIMESDFTLSFSSGLG